MSVAMNEDGMSSRYQKYNFLVSMTPQEYEAHRKYGVSVRADFELVALDETTNTLHQGWDAKSLGDEINEYHRSQGWPYRIHPDPETWDVPLMNQFLRMCADQYKWAENGKVFDSWMLAGTGSWPHKMARVYPLVPWTIAEEDESQEEKTAPTATASA